MAKVISQETFDETIKENLELCDNSVDEARKETISQFEAMGVNLANIITDLTINESTGMPILNESIEYLKNVAENGNSDDLKSTLETLNNELTKSVPHRVHAFKLNCKDYLITIIQKEIKNSPDDLIILKSSLTCINSLTSKNPDIFDNKCLNLVLEILKTQSDGEVIVSTLKWMQRSCILHEMNRQMIMDCDPILQHLKKLLTERNDEKIILKNVNACFRFLILDDDIRVEFGKAHEHAKTIAMECLVDLTSLLKKFEDDSDALADLMLTIASLIVRNEFCQTVADADGVPLVLNVMMHDFEQQEKNIKVIREGLKILKALAGNDKVKVDIIRNGAASIIARSLDNFKSDELIAKSALLCISTLTLRVKENSTAFWDTGIAEVIIDTMKIHEKNKMVQRNGAWAVRNMVSRSRDQCKDWLSFGIEDVLITATKNHPSIEHDVKSALRDLGADVKLIEEWKGNPEKIIQQTTEENASA